MGQPHKTNQSKAESFLFDPDMGYQNNPNWIVFDPVVTGEYE